VCGRGVGVVVKKLALAGILVAGRGGKKKNKKKKKKKKTKKKKKLPGQKWGMWGEGTPPCQWNPPQHFVGTVRVRCVYCCPTDLPLVLGDASISEPGPRARQ